MERKEIGIILLIIGSVILVLGSWLTIELFRNGIFGGGVLCLILTLGFGLLFIILGLWMILSKSEKEEIDDSKTFDLKDFKGIQPYSANYVGTFQPLIGWYGKTKKTWVLKQMGNALNALVETIKIENLRLKRTAYVGGFKDSGPELLYNNAFKWMRSSLMVDNGKQLKKMIEDHKKKQTIPKISDFLGVIKNLIDQKVNPNISKSQIPTRAKSSKGNPSPEEIKSKSNLPNIFEERKFLKSRGFEVLRKVKKAQVLLGTFSDIEDGKIPEFFLEKAIESRSNYYKQVLWWISTMMPTQPMASREEGFKLSPIGIMNLYRHYFYDLGTFLGPPVEHVWVAPYSETALIEASSQTSYRFRESETSYEILQAEEEAVTEAKELSDEMQRKTESDIKIGISSEFGFKTGIYHGGGSFTMDYGMHLSNDKKTVRKQSRELSSKISSEMKRSTRLLTRESIETRTESTRRHIIKNPTDKLVSYEICRKMRRVGIQAQHLGSRLCWVLYIDEPGQDIGLSELVHVAKPQDFSTIPPPDLAPPSFDVAPEDFQFTVSFEPTSDEYDDNTDYHRGKGCDDACRIKWQFEFSAPSPQPGYELVSVVQKNFERTDPDHDKPSLWALRYRVLDKKTGKFRVRLNDVNFEKQPAVTVTVGLTWNVSEKTRQDAEDQYATGIATYEQAKQREAQIAMVNALRERIELARSVSPRPSEDLRNEERKILYRRALRILLGPELTSEAFHVNSELVRTYFEIDKMLYFVAPDWWNPHIVRKKTQIYAGEMPFSFEVIITVSEGESESIPAGNYPYEIKGFITNFNADVIEYSYTWEVFSDPDSGIDSSIGPIAGTGSVPNPNDTTKQNLDVEFYIIQGFSIPGQIPNPFYQSDLDDTVYEGSLSHVQFIREQIKRPNNYMITEDSDPAPLGSSIGWLVQLDGDSHRSAFLNAAWAKVVIPIRRGREVSAKKWLKQAEIEDEDGLDADYLDEDGNPVPRTGAGGNVTIDEMLNKLIAELSRYDDDRYYLESQKVYETGFNPLPGGFSPTKDPFEIFAQWVEIVPTNQIVPVKYKTQREK